MKFKLRFDSDDMKRFLLVCLLVFYIIAIAVSNASSFTETGEFTFFNPLPAFSAKLILPTIFFYGVAIFFLMKSANSTFFEFENGFGFTTDKKLDGYSKWATDSDMKKELKMIRPTDVKTNHAGIALINNGKKIWVDDGDYHNLIIGSTGSGKTQNIIFPSIEILAKHSESMIITDPKGELYEKKSNMLRSKGYNIVVLNFRNPGRGNAWNPMTLPYNLYKNGNRDKAMELLDDLALNILYDEGNKNADPFWEKTSADYFSGLALGLFDDASESEINLNSISLMTTVGEDKIGGSTYIKEYFNLKDPGSSAYINASSTILAPSDTKMSILAVFKQKIKLFASRENLSEMLSYSDFDIGDIGRKKTAVFIIVQDEKKTYHSLVTIFIKQVYETLIDVAQSSPKNKLPIRTNFLLDEFANMPPLKDVTTMITAARSRAMRFTMIIQNYAQLNEVYGEQNAETIKGNCGNTVYLISTELKALKEISEMCGEIKVKTDKKDAEGKEIEETRPLITVSDLQRMKMNEVIVRRIRLAPFKTKLTPEWQMKWEHKYKEASVNNIKEREKREVKMFDVREYVKEHKKNTGNPFGSPFGGSPFGGSPFGSSPFGGSPFGESQSSIPNIFDDKKVSGESSNKGKIDVDKILANLDAKIAEIEAEEKKLAFEDEKNKKEENKKEENKKDEEFDSIDSQLEKNENKVSDEEISNIHDLLDKVEDDYTSINNKQDYSLENSNKDIDLYVDKINSVSKNNQISSNLNSQNLNNNMVNSQNNIVNNMNNNFNKINNVNNNMNNMYNSMNNVKNRMNNMYNNVNNNMNNVNNQMNNMYNNMNNNMNNVNNRMNNMYNNMNNNMNNVNNRMNNVTNTNNNNNNRLGNENNKYREVNDNEFFNDMFDDE